MLHLLYSRFWHKVLYDIGVVGRKEPFQSLVSQGMILGEVCCTTPLPTHRATCLLHCLKRIVLSLAETWSPCGSRPRCLLSVVKQGDVMACCSVQLTCASALSMRAGGVHCVQGSGGQLCR